MSNILILGAGSMGTAFSIPCSDRNHSVSIVGSHLEDDFIDKINLEKKHPILNCDIPTNVSFYKFLSGYIVNYITMKKLLIFYQKL